MVAWSDYKRHAKERGALAYEVYVVRSTPEADPETVKSNLADHLTYLRSMEDAGSLVLAGPLSDESGENMLGAGQLVYRAQSMEEAREMAAADPMHQSGARSFTLQKWLINEGSLTISVGLSTGVAELK